MNKNKLKKTTEKKKFVELFENRSFNALLSFFIVLSTLIGYMYIRNAYDTLSTHISKLRNENEHLKQKLVTLESDVNEISRPGHIQKMAREKLGMVSTTPEPIQIIIRKKNNE